MLAPKGPGCISLCVHVCGNVHLCVCVCVYVHANLSACHGLTCLHEDESVPWSAKTTIPHVLFISIHANGWISICVWEETCIVELWSQIICAEGRRDESFSGRRRLKMRLMAADCEKIYKALSVHLVSSLTLGQRCCLCAQNNIVQDVHRMRWLDVYVFSICSTHLSPSSHEHRRVAFAARFGHLSSPQMIFYVTKNGAFERHLFVWLYPLKQQRINGRYDQNNFLDVSGSMYICSPTTLKTRGVRRHFILFSEPEFINPSICLKEYKVRKIQENLTLLSISDSTLSSVHIHDPLLLCPVETSCLMPVCHLTTCICCCSVDETILK